MCLKKFLDFFTMDQGRKQVETLYVLKPDQQLSIKDEIPKDR